MKCDRRAVWPSTPSECARPRWIVPVGVVALSAILEFDAYLSRREAERRARNEQHPANGGNAA